MDDYLPKPVKRKELDAVLTRWVPEDGEGATHKEEPEELRVRAVIEKLRELGGSEMLSELAQLFCDDTRSNLATLRKALEEGDAQSVEWVTHTLKGSSDSMGAVSMAAICTELQNLGISGDLSRAPVLLERLEAEFERVWLRLEAEITGS